MPTSVSVVVMSVVLLVSRPSAAQEADPLREQFEAAAEKMTFLSTSDIVYDRDASYHNISHDRLDSNNKTLRSLLARRPLEPLVPLLSHQSPKVRTLAAIAMFHTERPQALKHLAGMLDDNDETYPQPIRISALRFEPDPEPPMQSQTVGHVVEELMKAMLLRCHGNFRLDGEFRADSLKRFWASREERDYWIGWYEFRMDRATQGTSVTPHRIWYINAIANEIQQLPPIEREVYYLTIFSQADRLQLRGENRLKYAARRLGPDRLLSLVAGKPVIDDPDLPAYVGRIQRYVYRHADELLRPGDADRLLDIGRKSNHIDAFIAAATLAPRQASDILHEAFGAQQGEHDGSQRSQAAIALWRLVGEDEADFLVEWFFTDWSPKMGRPPYRADLTTFLLERFQAGDRKLLARLIRDERMNKIDLPTHRLIVKGINRNLLHPIIDHEEERKARHPLGDVHFDAMIDRARKEYPEQTKALLTQLARWRTKLRASIEQWESP